MGGPPSATNTESGLGEQQTALANTEQSLGVANQTTGTGLLQPAINLNTEIASGDQSQILKTIAPQVGAITGQENQAREEIYDTTAPGAARDVALSQLPIQAGSQIASTENQAYNSSFSNLAAIGQGLSGTGLQQTGAGLSGLAGASTTTANVANQQEQAKASTLGFFGQLAGAGGSALSGTSLFCYCAELIYGRFDYRTHLIRAWLYTAFADTVLGRCVLPFYGRFGERIADIGRCSPLVYAAIEAVFARALRKAEAYYEEVS